MKPLKANQIDRRDQAQARPDLQHFEVIDLGPFLNNKNTVTAVNNLGQRAGSSLHEATGRVEAFLELGGTRMMLGTLGGSFSIARGMNNCGEIVGGSLVEGDEDFHGFLYRNGKLTNLNDLIDRASGWEVIQAVSVNDDGEIIGIGSNLGEDRILLLRPRN